MPSVAKAAPSFATLIPTLPRPFETELKAPAVRLTAVIGIETALAAAIFLPEIFCPNFKF